MWEKSISDRCKSKALRWGQAYGVVGTAKRSVWLEGVVNRQCGRRGPAEVGRHQIMEDVSQRRLGFIQSVKRSHLRIGETC